MTAIPLPSPIIAQAVKLFAERGYAETNLPSIAKAAKVAVGTIYRHFKSKEDILNTAFTRYYELLPRLPGNRGKLPTG